MIKILIFILPFSLWANWSELSLAYELSFSNQHPKTDADISDFIEEPPNTWIQLIKGKRWQNFDFESELLCLYYRTPFKKIKGELVLTITKDDQINCPSVPSDNKIMSKKNISNFNFYFRENNLVFQWDEGRATFVKEVVPLINFIKNQQGKLKKRNEYLIHSISTSEQWRLPKLKLTDGPNEICHEITLNCEELKPFICHKKCRGQWWPINRQGCSYINSKVCGHDQCGAKGEWACIRGSFKEDLDDFCQNPTDYGFCNGDLNPICENGYLICT